MLHHSAIEQRAEAAIFSDAFVADAELAYGAAEVNIGCRRVGRLRFVCRLEVYGASDGRDYCVRIGARVVRPVRAPSADLWQSGSGVWRPGISSLVYWPAGDCRL